MITSLNQNKDSFLEVGDDQLQGGIQEKWNGLKEKLNQEIERPIPETSVGNVGVYLDVNATLNRLEIPVVLNGETVTFEDIANHARIRQRLAEGTIQRNLRYLRFMEKHPCPVDLRHPTFENFIRHMDYREQVEGSRWGALKHQWQAMIMLLRAYGVNTKTWYYKPPTRPNYKTIPVPFPEQVHKIIHMKYSDDEYEDALVRYILCHNYIIGWRPPSEPCITKLSDVDIDNGILKVTCPKLHYATRNLDISELTNRHNVLSFDNWIKWRNKVENQYSKDYLYLKPDGRPFEKTTAMRSLLYKNAYDKIREIFPEYYNYTSRHFCAIARLIRTKIQSKHFDEYEVSNWLGHTKIETTMTYLKHAEFYYRKAPYDWIKCVLKIQKCMDEENALKTDKPPENLCIHWKLSERVSRRPPYLQRFLGEKTGDKTPIFGLIEFLTYSLKPIFFSFFARCAL